MPVDKYIYGAGVELKGSFCVYIYNAIGSIFYWKWSNCIGSVACDLVILNDGNAFTVSDMYLEIWLLFVILY